MKVHAQMKSSSAVLLQHKPAEADTLAMTNQFTMHIFMLDRKKVM